MNIWHDIDGKRIAENKFEALIEIPTLYVYGLSR